MLLCNEDLGHGNKLALEFSLISTLYNKETRVEERLFRHICV